MRVIKKTIEDEVITSGEVMRALRNECKCVIVRKTLHGEITILHKRYSDSMYKWINIQWPYGGRDYATGIPLEQLEGHLSKYIDEIHYFKDIKEFAEWLITEQGE